MKYQMKWYFWPIFGPIDFAGKLFVRPFCKRKRPDDSDVKRIAVMRFEHLGDMLLVSPFVRALRSKYPKARVDILCKGY